MKIPLLPVALLATSILVGFATAQQFGNNYNNFIRNNRLARQSPSADQMVQNILRWLEGEYTKQSRRIRQGTIKEYLPPFNTDKPTGFTSAPPGSGGVDEDGNFVDSGYPPKGTSPEPPFTLPPGAPSEKPGFPTAPPPGLTPGVTGPEQPGTTQPGGPGATEEPQKPGFPTAPPPGFTPSVTGPTEQPEKPGFPTQPPPGYTTKPPGPEAPGTTAPETTPSQPEGPTVTPTGYTYKTPEPTPGVPGITPGPEQPGTTTRPEGPETTAPGATPGPEGPEGTTARPGATPEQPGSEGTTTKPGEAPGTPGPKELTTTPGGEPGTTKAPGTEPGVTPDDDRHPPHIHAIDVECGKEMMTINIEFNRPFNGVIYSKGYYNMPECRYVQENSNQIKFSFTVNLNMCGTEFVNAFDTEGQSYLENVLVIQNEVGVQEVWDTVRSVRCLWEGNLKEQLSVSLMVGMLSQEIVTFSGDTAMAKLDVLQGRGAFGQPANGLVKIGDPLTLVVSVSGDPGFDVQVKDCRATDSTGSNTIPLTDDDGCILKPKLFGAFQKTRNTENTGASVIAYAYFNAFKFPDVMDLMIECNIELCKTDCEMCPKTDQALEPAKRRRRREANNTTMLHDGVAMGKHLRVILPEDLASATAALGNEVAATSVCMSTQSFVFGSSLLVSLLTASCVLTAYLWLRRNRRETSKLAAY
ncbi:unnamed protein product [Callosobruchus maculatus]|uniref:ZP domain-containing protein n=1 Tax=Callosobruchus maculatus TaxID=64391 RepID=A0A653CW60_CALMS|nr:unnamed protein product [Callosobruchus maculatus]